MMVRSVLATALAMALTACGGGGGGGSNVRVDPPPTTPTRPGSTKSASVVISELDPHIS